MKFIEDARRSLTGLTDPSPRSALQIALGHMLKIACVLSLLCGSAIFGSLYVSAGCEELFSIANSFGGILAAVCALSFFLIFSYPSGSSTQYKVILHPWSIKELIEVSITSGTVTIGFLEIILVYLYHFALLAAAIASIVAAVMLSYNLDCKDSNPYVFYSLSASSATTLIATATMNIICMQSIPYGPFEYICLYIRNLGRGILTFGGYLKGAVSSA